MTIMGLQPKFLGTAFVRFVLEPEIVAQCADLLKLPTRDHISRKKSWQLFNHFLRIASNHGRKRQTTRLHRQQRCIECGHSRFVRRRTEHNEKASESAGADTKTYRIQSHRALPVGQIMRTPAVKIVLAFYYHDTVRSNICVFQTIT